MTHAARLADDQEKLTAHFRTLVDLLLEADHWATVTGSKLIEERQPRFVGMFFDAKGGRMRV